MGSFCCYDSSDVIATLMTTNFYLNTTEVAIFPNVCLWRRSLCSDLVLTLKNCIEPPSYARTAYVVAIWPSFLFDSFAKIWATCMIFLDKWFTPSPPWQKISRTPMVTVPTWVAHSFQKTYTVLPYCRIQSFVDSGKWEATAVLQKGKEGRLFQCGTLLYIRLNRCYRD